ncbi:DNA-directed RNA polymerase subunit beta like [Actinidia chinensis var. chinensis]|uniref:DNA-directed RNA polymerase subunit beta like n=1 Tax=Actinidia chinensis var. chinensis TaxID=1590841 RepID=A0A2R6RG57_ACTCC|nr:DNA-directed RNA polymerase subunit beta like [Actinidia chinensis var. chinensis]
MPLPWKKAKKCNRITQLVADHLNSPKHGGPLVVETGFPISLVDLFVKNRDILKKSTKKKRINAKTPDPIPILSRPSSPLCVPPSSKHLNSPLGRFRNEVVVVEDADEQSGVVGDDGCEENGVVVGQKRILMVILKMVFVVFVLALATRKFVVGIMVTAFSPLFVEFAGKRLCRLVEPCADAQKSLRCFIERVVCIVGIKDGVFEEAIQQEETTLTVSRGSVLMKRDNMNDPTQEIVVSQPNYHLGSRELMEGHKMNDVIQKIEIVQPSPSLVPPSLEIQSVKYEFDLRSGEEKWVSKEKGTRKEVIEEEKASENDGLDVKSGRTRSGRIKSKIKKLVPKKFHHSRKKHLEWKSEPNSSGGDNKVKIVEEKELVEDGQQIALENGGYYPSSLTCGGNGDQVTVEDPICSSCELSCENSEESIVREHVRRETHRNSGYLMIFVIVLVGLVAGRVSALGLTLSWCLLLKSVETLKISVFWNWNSKCR